MYVCVVIFFLAEKSGLPCDVQRLYGSLPARRRVECLSPSKHTYVHTCTVFIFFFSTTYNAHSTAHHEAEPRPVPGLSLRPVGAQAQWGERSRRHHYAKIVQFFLPLPSFSPQPLLSWVIFGWPPHTRELPGAPECGGCGGGYPAYR